MSTCFTVNSPYLFTLCCITCIATKSNYILKILRSGFILNFPKKLKLLRTNLNVPQKFIADELGVTRQAYSLYETGKRYPPLDTLEKLCIIFEVDMNELTGVTQERISSMGLANLRSLRIHATKSEDEIAQFLQVPPSTYRDWEAARKPICKIAARQLAEYFHVTTNYILGIPNKSLPKDSTVKAVEEVANVICVNGTDGIAKFFRIEKVQDDMADIFIQAMKEPE